VASLRDENNLDGDSKVVTIHRKEQKAHSKKKDRKEPAPDVDLALAEPLTLVDAQPVLDILQVIIAADEKQREDLNDIRHSNKQVVIFVVGIISFLAGIISVGKAYQNCNMCWGTSHLQDPLALDVGIGALSITGFNCLLSCVVRRFRPCDSQEALFYDDAIFTDAQNELIANLTGRLGIDITPDLTVISLAQQITDGLPVEKQKEKQRQWSLGVCDLLKTTGIFGRNNSIQPQAGIILSYASNFPEVSRQISDSLGIESAEKTNNAGYPRKIGRNSVIL
jgi:hypothetical protein